MAASEEQVSKYLISVGQFVVPTIEDFDLDDVKDKLHDELRGEVKEELVQEIQDAADAKEAEMDSALADIDTAIEEAKEALQTAIALVDDLTTNTGFRVEDEI